MIEILEQEKCPKWLIYPESYLKLIREEKDTFSHWCLIEKNFALMKLEGLKERYPRRKLFAFACRDDNDDIACWEKKFGDQVIVMHDFTSPGWERRQIFKDFDTWYQWVLKEKENDENEEAWADAWERSELSKTISHALRHEPWCYELELEKDGWVSIQNLITGMANERQIWKDLNKNDLLEMIQKSEKKRHEIIGDKIRALYGHTVDLELNPVERVPPKILYHGTGMDALNAIKRNGLLPMARRYVHFSSDFSMAVEVGKRKDKKPIVLEILALQAHLAGIKFYRGNEQVWLASQLPPQFISEEIPT